jgi:hypothetical protein
MSEKITKVFDLMVKGPYGLVALLIASIWLLGTLSPQQVQQVKDFWPAINTPVGWMLVGFTILIWMYMNLLKPAGTGITQMFNAYLEKEKEYVQAFDEVKKELNGIIHAIEQLMYRIAEDEHSSQVTFQHMLDKDREHYDGIIHHLEDILVEHITNMADMKSNLIMQQRKETR